MQDKYSRALDSAITRMDYLRAGLRIDFKSGCLLNGELGKFCCGEASLFLTPLRNVLRKHDRKRCANAVFALDRNGPALQFNEFFG